MIVFVFRRAMTMRRQWQVQDETFALEQPFFGTAERAPEFGIASIVERRFVHGASVFRNTVWM